MESKAFAFFDFDGTLCRGDSILPFLLYAVRQGIAPKRQLLHALMGFLRQKADADQVVHAKEASLSFIRGRSQAEMDAFARGFALDVLVPGFFAEGLQELERLRSQGVTVVIVSASPSIYMQVLPEFLPVDAIIATPCEVDASGCYTGRISCNCKGGQKPALISEWLATRGWAIDRSVSSAYGDSASDAPMLRLTAQPVLVNPKPALRKAMPEARLVRWRPKDKE